MKINSIILFLVFSLLFIFIFIIPVKAEPIYGQTLDNIYEFYPSTRCSLNYNKYSVDLTQGMYFFDSKVVYAGYTGNDDPMNLTLVDLDSCSILDQNKSTVMYHANDIAYNSRTGKYYVAGGLKKIYPFSIINNNIVVDSNVIASKSNIISLAYDYNNNQYYVRSGSSFYKLSELGGSFVKLPIEYVNRYMNIENESYYLTAQTVEYYNGNLYFLRTMTERASSFYGGSFISVYNASTGEYKYTLHIPNSYFSGHLEGATISNNKISLGFNVHLSNTEKKIVFMEYTGIDEFEERYNAIVKNTELVKTDEISIIKGQSFDYSKIKIKKTHNNNTVTMIDLNSDNCILKDFNNSKIGKQTVKVIYEQNEYSFDIVIVNVEELDRELKYSGPYELNKGESINLNNFTVIIHYNDGSLKNVKLSDKIAKIDKYDKNKVGKQTINVVYDGKSYSIDVVVLERKEVSRELIIKNNIELYEDDKIDLKNYAVLIKYNDGSDREVELNDKNAKIDGYDKSKTGKQKIKIVYEKKAYPIEVIILEKIEESRELVSKKSIKIYEGEDIDINNFSILIKYNNGTEKKIKLNDKNSKIMIFDNKKIGEQTIIIVHDDKKYEYKIVVLEKKEVSRELKTKKLSYIVVGESLDLSKYYFVVKYNNNTNEEIPLNRLNVEIKDFDNTKIGKQKVKIMYEGKEYFVVVEVKNKDQIDKKENQRNSLIVIVVVIVLICGGFLYHVFFKRKWKNLRNNNS